jgi:hypothetical protein
MVVLMLIAGLLVVGQMAMLLLDSVTQRSGTFRRLEQGEYCAEEGLNLGRAWVMQNAALSGSVNSMILTGPPAGVGTGLFADPSNPNDFTRLSSKRAVPGKDLCALSSTVATAIGTQSVFGLAGICRLMSINDPNNAWCVAGGGTAPCPMYRINLIDDMDEMPPTQIDPYTDHNQAFFVRSECMAQNVNSITTGQKAVVTPIAVTTNLETQPWDDVAFIEVLEQSGLTKNPGGVGGGYGG